jgi:uridine kinase/general stress protein 26
VSEPHTELDLRFSEPDTAPTSWNDAVEVLDTAQLAWITTVRADGRPHVTPLVAIRHDGAYYFATGPTEQKAVNLGHSSAVVMTTGRNDWESGLDVVVEGNARRVTDQPTLEELANENNRRSPLDVSGPLLDLLAVELARRTTSMFVAVDGRSGSGKSTVAALVAERLSGNATASSLVTVIEGDQFYAGGSASTWEGRSPAERASCVIDWRRQRTLLDQLRNGGEGTWYAFDWDSENWDSDDVPFRCEPIRSVVAPVVILEGSYSARPELHDVLDLRVLLDVPTEVRRQQLVEREGEEYRSDWETRWSAAEDYYFGSVMPPQRFDLVLGRT